MLADHQGPRAMNEHRPMHQVSEWPSKDRATGQRLRPPARPGSLSPAARGGARCSARAPGAEGSRQPNCARRCLQQPGVTSGLSPQSLVLNGVLLTHGLCHLLRFQSSPDDVKY
jgi:hypothetical protein